MLSLHISLLLAVVPIFALAAIVLLQIMMAWTWPNRSPWWSLSIASPIGMVLTVLATIVISIHHPDAEVLSYTMVNCAACIALAFCYFNFVNLNYTSLRIRMLRELLTHENGVSMDELKARYSADVVLDLRLKRLVSSNQLRFDGARYQLGGSRTLLAIGMLIDAIRSLLGFPNRHSSP